MSKLEKQTSLPRRQIFRKVDILIDRTTSELSAKPIRKRAKKAKRK